MRREGDHSTAGSQDSISGKCSLAPREPRVPRREHQVRFLSRVPVPIRPARGHPVVASVQPDVRLHASCCGYQRPYFLHSRRPQPRSATHGSDRPDPKAHHGAQARHVVRSAVVRSGRGPYTGLAQKRSPERVVRVWRRPGGRFLVPISVTDGSQGSSGIPLFILNRYCIVLMVLTGINIRRRYVITVSCDPGYRMGV